MTSTIETEDVVEARTAKSLPCPFCGATPHHGPTKIEYDQHGDPFQRFAIWCPKGHARIVAPDETSANAAWNARPDTIERLREENARLQADAELGRKFRLGQLPFQQPTGPCGQ